MITVVEGVVLTILLIVTIMLIVFLGKLMWDYMKPKRDDPILHFSHPTFKTNKEQIMEAEIEKLKEDLRETLNGANELIDNLKARLEAAEGYCKMIDDEVIKDYASEQRESYQKDKQIEKLKHELEYIKEEYSKLNKKTESYIRILNAHWRGEAEAMDKDKALTFGKEKTRIGDYKAERVFCKLGDDYYYAGWRDCCHYIFNPKKKKE